MAPKVSDSLDFATSSTDAIKQCLAASVSALDPKAAESITSDNTFRATYYKAFVDIAKLSVTTPDAALDIAKRGLAATREVFVQRGNSLREVEAQEFEAMTSPPKFYSVVVEGSAAPSPFRCPWAGRDLRIGELATAMSKLVAKGAAEPTAQQSLETLAANPAMLDLSSGPFVFAVLGAGSQMGPARSLLAMGATVMAVDLPNRPKSWAPLVAYARASPGRLIVPVAVGDSSRLSGVPEEDEELCAAAGADVLVNWAEIAKWMVTSAGSQRLVIGSYLYADAGLFTRISMAADAIVSAVCAARPDTALASICSPTEVFSVPAEANAEARRRYRTWNVHTPWQRAFGAASGYRYLEENIPQNVNGHLIQDSQCWQQGPNYAFSKLIQRWRCIVARSCGHTVSSNVAPMTVTESVMHNPLVKAGALGCQIFGIVPFEPDTSNALMTAFTVFDLKDPSSPSNPEVQLAHPLQLFEHNSVHGGTWRCAYKTNSYTEVSAMVFGVKAVAPYVGAAGFGLAMWKRSRMSKL